MQTDNVLTFASRQAPFALCFRISLNNFGENRKHGKVDQAAYGLYLCC